MKIAFAYWDNRIAPVFDTSRQIYVIDAKSGHIVSEAEEVLIDDLPVGKILRLVELGIDIVVCGAISRSTYELVSAYGIHVVPFVAGDLGEVIRVWLSGNLDSETFTMPGCGGRGGRHIKLMQGRLVKENSMNQRGRGMGAGGGRGEGQGGQNPGRPGRMGGPKTAGPSGYCVCPQCGQKEAHERGAPCLERKCSKCGANMARQ